MFDLFVWLIRVDLYVQFFVRFHVRYFCPTCSCPIFVRFFVWIFCPISCPIFIRFSMSDFFVRLLHVRFSLSDSFVLFFCPIYFVRLAHARFFVWYFCPTCSLPIFFWFFDPISCPIFARFLSDFLRPICFAGFFCPTCSCPIFFVRFFRPIFVRFILSDVFMSDFFVLFSLSDFLPYFLPDLMSRLFVRFFILFFGRFVVTLFWVLSRQKSRHVWVSYSSSHQWRRTWPWDSREQP